MANRKITTLLMTATFGVALGLAPASAAMADPAGCSKGLGDFGQNAGSALYASGSGACDSLASRILRLEIKQDLSFQPDPVAMDAADADYNTSYAVAIEGCDEGRSGTYYSRVFFDGHSDYLDSSYKAFDVC